MNPKSEYDERYGFTSTSSYIFVRGIQGMKTIEFYWNDLTEKKQKEILKIFGENCNWDVIPFATIDYEEEED